MTVDLIVKKVKAEKDVSNSFGDFKLYSFIMFLIDNPIKTRRILIEYFGFTKTRATRVASRYNHYQRTKA